MAEVDEYQKEFERYEIWHFHNSYLAASDQPSLFPMVLIKCYEDHRGQDPVGTISFHPAIVVPGHQGSEEKIDLHFPIDRFPDVIGTLRSEKPLWLWYEMTDLGEKGTRLRGGLHTGIEKVG
jgi:hypothetical protein